MENEQVEGLWSQFLSGNGRSVASLVATGGAWDDPIFDGAAGDKVPEAVERLASWYREKAAGPVRHLATTVGDRRIAVESVLGMKDGLIWDPFAGKAERARDFELPVAVVAQKSGAPGRFAAIRVYFGTWSVLDGKPKIRKGPIAPDERSETRQVMDGCPVLRDYFDCLARGDAAIQQAFEPDGYFREPANNYSCGGDQLNSHFSHILKLGGVGVEFLTATHQGDRYTFELQTVVWGKKRMDVPQAGFASYNLGPHGKVQGARVYDSVVPPEL